jgi:hypothetical protein
MEEIAIRGGTRLVKTVESLYHQAHNREVVVMTIRVVSYGDNKPLFEYQESISVANDCVAQNTGEPRYEFAKDTLIGSCPVIDINGSLRDTVIPKV